MIGRNDFHFGGQVEAIGEFINNYGTRLIKWLIIFSIVCVPIAAIKYLFWG